MRYRVFLLVFWAISCLSTAIAEQAVERHGKQVLTFDVPGVNLLGQKDRRTTRASFVKALGNVEVRITIYVSDIASADTIDESFRKERLWVRASPDDRLRQDDVAIPGALKVITYSSTAPFNAEIIVAFSKNYRCQLMITSKSGDKAQIEAVFQELLASLNLRQRGIISPIRLDSEIPQPKGPDPGAEPIKIRGLPQSNSLP